MALDNAALANALVTAFTANLSSSGSQADQIHDTALAMADAIQAFVESATITYIAGLVAPDGPVTGVFTGTIS